MKRGIKFLAKVGVVAAFGVGFAIVSQAGASATTEAATPAVTAASVAVTPSSGLADGATVQLTGSGLTAGETYFVGECSAVAANDYACDNATNFEAVADASGAISVPVTVHTAFTGTTGSGATHAIDCTVDTCVVAAYSATFEGGAVPISFN